MSSSIGTGMTAISILLLVIMLTVSVSGQIESPSPSAYVNGEPSSAPTATIESPAMAPTVVADCMTSLLNLSDCLSYVESGSNLTVPEKACCPELAGLVDSNPICLCELLGTDDTYGIKIDINKALMLPSVCKVPTPPASLCPAAVGGPSEAPEGMPPGGFASNPMPANGDNASSSIIISVQALIAALALAFLPIFF